MIGTRIVDVVIRFGVTGLLWRGMGLAYRRGVRPWLPNSDVVRYAGLPIARSRKLGDRFVPRLWRPKGLDDLPEYEGALVSALRRHVLPGDEIVVVGGGVGVTATVAAMQTGPTGHVICYEGAAEGAEMVRRTAVINGVAERLTVEHAVVARSISVYGTEPDRQTVRPEELPVCDVLELDCEGAEIDILRKMVIQPRVILVETHGLFDAPTVLVESLLQERGYSSEVVGVAESWQAAYCAENDIRIVVGTRKIPATPA